ncbi:lipopolysaccharide heptosyltransferase family protein [Achromobacter sp. KS-M25]|nr:lipopolysaccharide heptosyltransferase family protein [Achromobacter aestuarii]
MSDVAVFIRSMRFFGGHVVTYPLLYALHRHMGGKRVRIIARDPVDQNYLCLPWPVDFVQAKGFWSHVVSLPRGARLMMALHYTSDRYGLVAAIRRPAARLGFTNKRLTDRVWTHACKKDFEEYLAVANVRLLSQYLPIDIEANARECFETIAASAARSPHATDIVLMPGGGDGEYKRWGLKNFLPLLAGLRAELGEHLTATFVLGPDEHEEHAALVAANLPGVHLMMTRPLAEIAHVCIHARLIVANDCGPSHIGQSACVPYVGVFHRHNPQWYWDRPYSRCVTPLGDCVDIQTIEPGDVLDACLEVWPASDRATVSAPAVRRVHAPPARAMV